MKYWKKLKLRLKMSIRFANDIITRDVFRFSRRRNNVIDFPYFISIRQEIKQNETFESKIYNFLVASKAINQYVILPNEIFSFWKIIGNPNKHFKKGRTIQNGKIIEDIGGGLCQVSGIIYHISLIAGLKIIERHNHSVDIYDDETRFCPLGTDATLVYGYKDLRIKNTNAFPIKFEIQIIDNHLVIQLFSTAVIIKNRLTFNVTKQSARTTVKISNEAGETLNVSHYKNIC
jgi:vancomycin resistance protein VanW